MSIILYGIKNCDTVKKARRWLETQQIEYIFHDFRVDGLTEDMLKDFLKHVDSETLLNKRGTAQHKLSEDQKQGISKQKAIALMAENPTLIKWPVLDHEGGYLVGFSEGIYEHTLFIKRQQLS
jgi:Spx/MgsR family transcriptional regulator